MPLHKGWGLTSMSFLPPEVVEAMARRREQINSLTAVAGNNSMQRNLQREDRLAYQTQKKAFEAQWGEAMPEDDDTINNTFDSPVTHNHYHGEPQQSQPQQSLLKTVLPWVAGLALGPAAGVGAAYLMQDKPAAVETEDETVRLGLGRIEDLVK